MSDLAKAVSSIVDRNVSGGATTRRGVVTAISPLTVTVGGVSIASMPYVTSYSPVVNDVVLILVDGPTMLVIDRISGSECDPQMSFKVVQAAFNDGSNSGLHDFTTNFPRTVLQNGWAVVQANAEFGFSSANLIGVYSMLYTNYASYSTYGGGSSAAIQGNISQDNPLTINTPNWAPLVPRTLTFPVAAGTTPSFTMRFGWTPNGNGVWMDYFASVVVYAG